MQNLPTQVVQQYGQQSDSYGTQTIAEKINNWLEANPYYKVANIHSTASFGLFVVFERFDPPFLQLDVKTGKVEMVK